MFATDAAAEVFESAVERLGGSVPGSGPVEVGERIDGSLRSAVSS